MTSRLIINWVIIFALLSVFTFGTIYSVFYGEIGTAYAAVVNENPQATLFVAFPNTTAGNARGIVSRIFTNLGNTFADEFICSVTPEQYSTLTSQHSSRVQTMRLSTRTVNVTHLTGNVNASDLKDFIGLDRCKIGTRLSFIFLAFAATLS